MSEPNCIRCRHPRSEHLIVENEPDVIPPSYRGRCLHVVPCDCPMYRTVTDVANSLMERASKAKAGKYYNSYSFIRRVSLIEHINVLEGHLERLRIDVNELLEAMDHEQFKD